MKRVRRLSLLVHEEFLVNARSSLAPLLWQAIFLEWPTITFALHGLCPDRWMWSCRKMISIGLRKCWNNLQFTSGCHFSQQAMNSFYSLLSILDILRYCSVPAIIQESELFLYKREINILALNRHSRKCAGTSTRNGPGKRSASSPDQPKHLHFSILEALI